MKKRYFFIFGGLIILFLISFIYFTRTEEVLFDEEAINDFMNEIAEPIRIVDADMLRDGGTILLIVNDSNDKEISFRLDGRMVVFDDKGRKVKERYLYLNDKSPIFEGAIKLPISGNEEKKVLRMVKEFRDNNPNYFDSLDYEEGDEWLRELRKESLDNFISRLERRN